jgi:Chitin synthase export chaperone
LVGFQIIDDGTPVSIGLICASAAALFVGTGYISLDTAFSFTHRFDGSQAFPNRNIGLYVLYQLLPLICIVLFLVMETYLVIVVLGERRPMRK